jgi:hypothetical protein
MMELIPVVNALLKQLSDRLPEARAAELESIADILADTAALDARASEARLAALESITDILADTAALDTRLSNTWAQRLNDTQSNVSTLLARITDSRAAALDSVARIKSIQRGTVTISENNLTATATITAVDPAKTLIMPLGFSASPTGSASDDAMKESLARIDLTNATTVTATRAEGGPGTSVVVGFQVVEYY